jgi:hypothetical protein
VAGAALSFGYFPLGKQRKVTRQSAETDFNNSDRGHIHKMDIWKFVGKSDEQRLSLLSQPFVFDELILKLKQEMQVVCFHRDVCDKDNTYSRPMFCVYIGFTLFDLFFNSASGYRGQYFESPNQGNNANRRLLDTLSPLLVNWALANNQPIDLDWLNTSLSQNSSKAWLVEYYALNCQECDNEWTSSYKPELMIENQRWNKSSNGAQAPQFSKIRIFGGFINHQKDEWVADHKKCRATHIWQNGWS